MTGNVVTRRTIMVGIALVAALSAGGSAIASTGGAEAASLEQRVLSEINDFRVGHGLEPLRAQAGLAKAASQHTSEMLARGYFGHASANGASFHKRMARYYPQRAQTESWGAGENLAWASGQPSAASFLSAWLASPHHRANLLDPNYRDAGVGVAIVARAPGAFGGRAVTVVTLDLGYR